MTNEQREKITTLRHQGFGYTAIANSVGLSKDSVKAYLMANADIAEKVEAQVRENLLKQSSAAPSAPAKAAERPIAVSADDFDDED